MGWKDRAKPVEMTHEAEPAPIPVSKEPGDLAHRSWRERAKPVSSEATDDPGIISTALHHGVSGFFRGGSDELVGGTTAMPTLHPLVEPRGAKLFEQELEAGNVGFKQPDGTVKRINTAGDAYRHGRDAERAELARGMKHHPGVAVGSQVFGDILSDFVVRQLGIPVQSSAYQTAMGMLTGLLTSDADLTDAKRTPGTIAEATGSTLLGGALNNVVPKAATALSSKVSNSPVAKWLGEKARTAAADQAADITSKAQKLFRTARSGLGGDSAAVMKTVEHAKDILQDKLAKPEDVAWATDFLTKPETRAAIDRARKNVRELSPELMGKMNTSQEAMAAARTGLAPEAIDAATDEVLSKPLKPVKDRLWKYGTRAIPMAIGSYIGNEVGGTEGAALGFVGGNLAGAALGDPGTAFKNVVNNPAVRKATAESLHAILTKVPEKLGKYAPVLTRQLQRYGPAGALVFDRVMAEKFPDYVRMKGEALNALGMD